MSQPPSTNFENILNFRDIGLYINSITSTQTLKPSLFYRSARPDSATPTDRALLKTTHKITTIIDLRTPTEHTEVQRKHHLPKNDNSSLRIPGIAYKDINFNGSAYSTALIKQLSYAHVAKLAGLYVLGYRKEAISVLGVNVMSARGLAGLAEDSLTHCTAEIKAFFDVLVNKASYPVLVHCTQGKDRTGLVVLLVLMLMGVGREAIEADYVRSEPELERERPEKLEEIRSIGLPDSFADCPKEWVGTVCGFIEEKYGGVERYLETCGVAKSQQDVVRGILGR